MSKPVSRPVWSNFISLSAPQRDEIMLTRSWGWHKNRITVYLVKELWCKWQISGFLRNTRLEFTDLYYVSLAVGPVRRASSKDIKCMETKSSKVWKQIRLQKKDQNGLRPGYCQKAREHQLDSNNKGTFSIRNKALFWNAWIQNSKLLSHGQYTIALQSLESNDKSTFF